ncbi:SOS response-associated peptidase [Euzebyella saccharophila]|uniref:Abasic site processing protein n=1 Tax=Euzebyella saccharophila TaxID=679664 RepID=A0ABV8JM49_9FLAO|nr:SOS response-associated peptidase [Euzebyella saccharophila]
MRSKKNGIWNKTLNARGETIFELPSFRDSAKKRRCLIHIDGFYEHHHFDDNTYPFFISRKDEKPLTLASLWSEWTNKEDGSHWNTFSVVTTEGNPLMSNIHNNPKLKGPRMPLILPEELENDWIEPYDENLWDKGQKKALEELIQSYPEEELKAHTVARLRGKEYAPNISDISEHIIYKELIF